MQMTYTIVFDVFDYTTHFFGKMVHNVLQHKVENYTHILFYEKILILYENKIENLFKFSHPEQTWMVQK